MPRPPNPLPADLTGRAFSLAEARSAGVRARLRGAHLGRPHWGVRSDIVCSTVRDRATALTTVLPEHCAFGSATAATLLDLPLPRELEEDHVDLHVYSPTGTPAVRRSGVVGHRGLERRRVIVHRGLRLVTPTDTWVDLAQLLGRDALVVVGDAIVAHNADLLPELRQRLHLAGGRPGVIVAREALGLVRPRCWSPMETRTRLLVGDAGLPEPELNAEVHDQARTWIATVDLLWRDQRVIVEYDGAVHADAAQRRLDVVRRRQLRTEGWTVIEIGQDDVLRWPDQLVALIRSALEGLAA